MCSVHADIGNSFDGAIVGLVLAFLHKVFHILEAIVGELSASLFVVVDEASEAVEVSGQREFLFVIEGAGEFLEDMIDLHSVVDFLSKFNVSLVGA